MLHQRIAAGEQEAIQRLVHLYSAWIQVVIRRILAGSIRKIDGRDVEELTADVFYKVCRDIEKFDPSRSKLKTWITMKTKSIARDFLRKQRREQEKIALEYREEVTIQATAHFLDGYEEMLLLQRFVKAVILLPESQRIFYELYDEGNTLLEIAKLTGKPEGTVKSTLYRTLKYLRTVIADPTVE